MIVTPKKDFEPNREYALRTIRSNIISLALEPGSIIGEQEIANKLGVSRTPVHEAFLELSKSKIIEIFPQKGCRVSMINFKLINEARFLRNNVEGAVVEETCEIASSEDISKLKEIVKLQEFYSDTPDKFFELDNDFHKTMYSICDKMQCYYMVSLMSIHFDRVRSLSLRSVKDSKIVSDHNAILKAIEAKNKSAAREAFDKHMHRFDLDWEVIEKEYGKYIDQV